MLQSGYITVNCVCYCWCILLSTVLNVCYCQVYVIVRCMLLSYVCYWHVCVLLSRVCYWHVYSVSNFFAYYRQNLAELEVSNASSTSKSTSGGGVHFPSGSRGSCITYALLVSTLTKNISITKAYLAVSSFSRCRVLQPTKQ